MGANDGSPEPRPRVPLHALVKDKERKRIERIATRLSNELRTLVARQPRDWGGLSAAKAYLDAAKKVEEEFGLESPPDPEISDGLDD